MATPRMEDKTGKIKLPTDLIRTSPGLGLDFGGTTLKVAYRHKSEFTNGQQLTQGEDSYIHVTLLNLGEVQENLSFIEENVDISRNDTSSQPTTVYFTGCRGTPYLNGLKQRFNINLQVVYEYDAFATAFRHLSSCLSDQVLCHEIPKSVIEIGKEVREELYAWRESITPLAGNIEPFQETTVEEQEEEAVNSRLPCIVVTAGSAFSMLKVNTNGTYTILDGIYPGGQTFMGMAKQMTGLQDYEKIMDLISSSDGRTVDFYAGDIAFSEEDYPIYTWSGRNILIFPFGKSTSIEQGSNQRQADLLFSLYNVSCIHLAHLARLNAKAAGVRNIYFCGNFVNSEVARTNIIKALGTHAIHGYNPIIKAADMNYQFPRHGGSYGAIGSLLYQC